MTPSHAECIEDDEHDGLDRDTAQNVADGNAEIVTHGGTGGDGDLREVRRYRQEDQASERLAQARAHLKHVRGVGDQYARDPHDGCSGHEDYTKTDKDSESSKVLLSSVLIILTRLCKRYAIKRFGH